MAKKKPRPHRKPVSTGLAEVRFGLIEAGKRERAGRPLEALGILEQLSRSHPRNVDVWGEMIQLGGRLNDSTVVEHACENLFAFNPDRPDILSTLVQLRLDGLRIALALEACEQFQSRFPDHPDAAKLQKLTTTLRPEVADVCERLGLTGPNGPAAFARHEESLRLLKRGDVEEAKRLAGRVLERYPHFVPALNNLAELHYREAEFGAAIVCARHVLETEPANVHALANLVRYLSVTGRREEALPYAERLRSAEPDQPNGWSKKAEAFSCLGEDEAVLEAVRNAETAGRTASPHDEAALSHLAGVAAYRLDREDEARQHWRHALRRMPRFAIAEANLADLDLPAEAQEGPWPFDMRELMPQKVAFGVYSASQRVAHKGDPEALNRVLRRHLDENPETVGVLAFQLLHGDPPGREFALMTAEASRYPALMPTVRDFALGRWGSCQMRVRAMNAAIEAELIPTGPVRFWTGTNWTQIVAQRTLIHTESLGHHSPEAQQLLVEATRALEANDGVTAERLMLQANDLEPDRPDIQFNIHAAYRVQGRDEEAERLVREIHARHPDYLFGCTEMARLHARAGKFEEADALLKPLLARGRLHRSEFRSIHMAMVDLLLEQGDIDAAKTWLRQWEGLDRGHPTLEAFRGYVAAAARKRR